MRRTCTLCRSLGAPSVCITCSSIRVCSVSRSCLSIASFCSRCVLVAMLVLFVEVRFTGTHMMSDIRNLTLQPFHSFDNSSQHRGHVVAALIGCRIEMVLSFDECVHGSF